MQVVLALGLDAFEEGFLLAAGDPQDVIEPGRDLGVVHPAQGVLQVERRLRRDQPDALPLQAHDVHGRLLRLRSCRVDPARPAVVS